MKVKEALLEEREKQEKILKKKGNLYLYELVERKGDLEYSKYLIYDMNNNVSYVRIKVPNPRCKDLYKDLYLKYQNGTRKFMMDLFDVFIGKKTDIEQRYREPQKEDFKFITFREIAEKRGYNIKNFFDMKDVVYINIIEDGETFAIINFLDLDKNIKFAKKFLDYFKGKNVSFSDEVGLCEQ